MKLILEFYYDASQPTLCLFVCTLFAHLLTLMLLSCPFLTIMILFGKTMMPSGGPVKVPSFVCVSFASIELSALIYHLDSIDEKVMQMVLH